jgi:hypothetical protein
MAAASAIEALFRPTDRLRDLCREQYDDDSYELQNEDQTEVELLPDLSPEHVLVTADITWEDFCHFVDDYILVWMGPDVYVCKDFSLNEGGMYVRVIQLGSTNHRLFVYAARGPGPETVAATTATCDFVVRLLATSKDNGKIEGYWDDFSAPISGPGLSCFFQESQDNLRRFRLENMILNEEQIRALATTEFLPGMEVILDYCSLSDGNGCHAAFVECLHRDRGPTVVDWCNIDCHVLAAALEGNSRVTWLRLADHSATSDAGKAVIFRSLAGNKGLVKLDLNHRPISDENWTILCQSLDKKNKGIGSRETRDCFPGSSLGSSLAIFIYGDCGSPYSSYKSYC